jgi:hypothetical protein
MSEDLNARAKALSEEGARLRERQQQIWREMLDIAAAARLFDVALTLPEGVTLPGGNTVRDHVLRRLAEAGTAGTTAAELQKGFGHLHPKTIGMTLYRLSKENICKRVGTRLWVIN